MFRYAIDHAGKAGGATLEPARQCEVMHSPRERSEGLVPDLATTIMDQRCARLWMFAGTDRNLVSTRSELSKSRAAPKIPTNCNLETTMSTATVTLNSHRK